MKLSIFLLSVLLFSACSKTPENANATNAAFDLKDSQVVVKEVSDVTEQLWTQGYPDRDTIVVGELLHAKFNLVDDEGSVFSRADELSYVAEFGDQYQNFTYEVDNVCVYENGTAVLTASCRFMGVDGEGAFATDYVQSLTFAKTDGSWKILYSQVSGVKEERFENAPGN